MVFSRKTLDIPLKILRARALQRLWWHPTMDQMTNPCNKQSNKAD